LHEGIPASTALDRGNGGMVPLPLGKIIVNCADHWLERLRSIDF